MNPPPEFIAERELIWQRLKAEQDAMLAAKKSEPIRWFREIGKSMTTQKEVFEGIFNYYETMFFLILKLYQRYISKMHLYSLTTVEVICSAEVASRQKIRVFYLFIMLIYGLNNNLVWPCLTESRWRESRGVPHLTTLPPVSARA